MPVMDRILPTLDSARAKIEYTPCNHTAGRGVSEPRVKFTMHPYHDVGCVCTVALKIPTGQPVVGHPASTQ
eukprot:SAG31_NODE_12136_length_965_cov_0.834873_2_plen_70_part_01